MSGLEENVDLRTVERPVENDNLEILKSIFSNVLSISERQTASQALLQRFGNVRHVLNAPEEQLENLEILSPCAMQELKRTRKLMRQILQADINNRPLLDNLDDVCQFCRAILAGKNREEFHALFLDESYYLLSHECIQVGTVNHVAVYPREIMSRALKQNASHLILIHNHPGGCERPSNNDIKMTKILMESARFLNITILDHVIVGRSTDFSFRKNGLMRNLKE